MGILIINDLTHILYSFFFPYNCVLFSNVLQRKGVGSTSEKQLDAKVVKLMHLFLFIIQNFLSYFILNNLFLS